MKDRTEKEGTFLNMIYYTSFINFSHVSGSYTIHSGNNCHQW